MLISISYISEPNNFKGYYNLAICISQFPNRLIESIEFFENAISLEPCVIESYESCAGVLIKVGNPTKAIECCYNGLNISPGNVTVLYNLNIALRQMSRINEAILINKSYLPKFKSKYIQNRIENSHLDVVTPILVVFVKWSAKYDASCKLNTYSGHPSHIYTFVSTLLISRLHIIFINRCQ